MDLKEIDKVNIDFDVHWYYQSKIRAVEKYLRGIPAQSLVDIGAGSGFFARQLLLKGLADQAVCVDPFYEREWTESVAGRPLAFHKEIQRLDADLVLFMDVLEHVDDEQAFLRHYADLAGKGTHFLLTVPAFNFLWSDHDVFLGHKRRYTVHTLEAALTRAGLQIVKASYFFAGVFPLAALHRMMGNLTSRRGSAPQTDLRQHGRVANAILSKICSWELTMMERNRWFGLTVFCLCRLNVALSRPGRCRHSHEEQVMTEVIGSASPDASQPSAFYRDPVKLANALTLVFVAALALRLSTDYLFRPTYLLNDEIDYYTRAIDLVQKGELHTGWRGVGGRPPLSGWYYALWMSFLGPNVEAARIGNTLLGSLTVLLLFYIALKLGGPKAGLIAALLGAFYPQFIAYSASLWNETIFIFLSLSAVSFLISYYQHQGIWKLCATGILLVKGMNRMRRQDEAPPAEPTTKECPFCFTTIPIKATECAFCTADLKS